MMGSSHAASGAAVWLALTATSLPALGVHELAPTEVLLGVAVAAGAALLPDADHHNATIAHAVPVAGRIATRTVGALTGGHRKGLHSLLAVVAVSFAMIALGRLIWTEDRLPLPVHVGSAVAAGACVTFAVKVLKVVRNRPVAWLVGVAVGLTIGLLPPEQTEWLPWCIGVGYLTHLAGDFLTTGGVPLLWPLPVTPPRSVRRMPVLRRLWLPRGAFALPLLGDTGSWREQAVFTVFVVYATWGITAETFAAVRLLSA